MGDVMEASADNKMKDEAVAVVFAPCLYDPPDLDTATTPAEMMQAALFSKKIVQFVLGLLHAYSTRRAERCRSAPSPSAQISSTSEISSTSGSGSRFHVTPMTNGSS